MPRRILMPAAARTAAPLPLPAWHKLVVDHLVEACHVAESAALEAVRSLVALTPRPLPLALTDIGTAQVLVHKNPWVLAGDPIDCALARDIVRMDYLGVDPRDTEFGLLLTYLREGRVIPAYEHRFLSR